MKHKRVDYYLAITSLIQVMMIGFGGAFASEVVDDAPRKIVLFAALPLAVGFGTVTIWMYVRIFNLVKKRK